MKDLWDNILTFEVKLCIREPRYLSSGHGRDVSVAPLSKSGRMVVWWCRPLPNGSPESPERREPLLFPSPNPPQTISPLRPNELRDDTARLLRTHTRLGVTRGVKEAPLPNITDAQLELNAFLSLSPSEKRPFAPYVTMILFSSRSVLLSVYYPQIFLILTSGSYL